ncbi:MAG: phosphonate metabolism transcriptional regulator PhnF [Geminicoccaceae bacterium]|nr:MAG: phosphonate metabolism transcriptional regulator PhnF [Geminicoccaceae bacterium]
MTTDPTVRGVARWRHVHDALVADLATLPVGARLPGEVALAERFAVNRHTVRRALQALAAAGRIRIEHGRGSFVRPDPIRYRLGERVSFTANLADQGRAARRRIEAIETEVAAPEIAGALGLAHGAPVVRAVSLAFADDVPLARSVHHFPAERLPGIAQALVGASGITAAFRALRQAVVHRASTRITSRAADDDEVLALHLAPEAPVLVTEGIDVDACGVVLQRVVTTFAGSRVELVVDHMSEG